MLGAQGCGKKTAYKEEWTMIGTNQDESKSSQYLTFSLRNQDFALAMVDKICQLLLGKHKIQGKGAYFQPC